MMNPLGSMRMEVTSNSGLFRRDPALRSRLWNAKPPADLAYPETYTTPAVSAAGQLKGFREVARLVQRVVERGSER